MLASPKGDRDHIALTEQRGDLRQHLPEGCVQCLGVDHLEHGRKGVKRWDRMLEVQEAFENMLF